MMSLHTVCMEMAVRDLRVKNESDYRAYQEYPAFCILKKNMQKHVMIFMNV